MTTKSRTLTQSVKDEIVKGNVYTCLLIHFGFSSDLYITDNSYDISHGGNTYLSSVGFMSISKVNESSEIRTSTISIVLSGANLSNVSLPLTEDYVNVPVTISRAVIDSNYAVISTPFIKYFGYITDYSITENIDEGKSTVLFNIASHWADFEKTSGRRTNNNDQQLYYPGDLGLEFSGEVLKDLKWGRP